MRMVRVLKKSSKLFIALVFIVICFVILTQNTHAASVYMYKWSDTSVTIPVGESIEKYKDIPKAVLYKDDLILSDAKITYDKEGDWLYYMKNVNTTKIGTYKVWYKAYDAVYTPGTCLDYKALVIFKVVDSIKPTLDIIDEIVNVKRGSEYDLSSNIVARDNYTNEPTIMFGGEVDLNKVGIYDVSVSVVDESGNRTTGNYKINVYSDSKPVIKCNVADNVIRIPLKEKYDISQMFSAADVVDGDISSLISYPELDTSEIREYDYTVSVKNSSNLETSYTVTIKIVDEEKPVLVLNTHSLILDYKTNFKTYDFKKHIKSLTDNLPIDYDNLIITNTCQNAVGIGQFKYDYTDGVYTVSDTIDVSLVSFDVPEISVDNISVKVKDNVNYLDYISITDESDPNIMSSVEIDDSDVDYSKGGTYYANAYCVNSSGLSSTKKFKVVVEDESFFSETKKESSYTILILGGVAGFLLLVIIVLLLKKNKKSEK